MSTLCVDKAFTLEIFWGMYFLGHPGKTTAIQHQLISSTPFSILLSQWFSSESLAVSSDSPAFSSDFPVIFLVDSPFFFGGSCFRGVRDGGRGPGRLYRRSGRGESGLHSPGVSAAPGGCPFVTDSWWKKWNENYIQLELEYRNYMELYIYIWLIMIIYIYIFLYIPIVMESWLNLYCNCFSRDWKWMEYKKWEYSLAGCNYWNMSYN